MSPLVLLKGREYVETSHHTTIFPILQLLLVTDLRNYNGLYYIHLMNS